MKPYLDLTQFNETKKRYYAATTAAGATYPLDYESWLKLPIDLRQAALFVNFYDVVYNEIVKTMDSGAFWMDAAMCINELFKTFTRFVNKPSKKAYNERYMRRIISNAYADVRKIKRDQEPVENEISNIVSGGNSEVDLFQTYIGDEYDFLDICIRKKNVGPFWKMIADLDNDALAYVDKILSNEKLGKRLMTKEDKIIDQLRVVLAPYKSIFMPEHYHDDPVFGDVISNQYDCITVKMDDGTAACYFGEQRVNKTTGDISFVFEGPEFDYVIPMSKAYGLKVLSTE